MLALIGLTIGSIFAWRRAVKPAESRLASIVVVGGVCLGSFTVVAVGPFLLMLPVFAASMALMALNFTDAGTWLNNNFALATVLMLPGTALLTAAAYLYGRWRAPEWQSKTFTLVGAGMRVGAIFVFGSMGVLAFVIVGGFLKANGLLG